jgi:hypothetical protein
MCARVFLVRIGLEGQALEVDIMAQRDLPDETSPQRMRHICGHRLT